MAAAARLLCALQGLTWILAPAVAGAYTVDQAEVHHRQGEYTIRFAVRIEADTERVRALITDYGHLDRLSPVIIASRVLETLPDGAHRVQVDMRPCVLRVFCRDLRRVEDTRVDANGDVRTEGVPDLGDFSRIAGHWRLVAGPEGTHLYYESALTPRFFVPPLVGPYLIRRALLRELEATAARLEQLSAATPAAVPNESPGTPP